MTARKTYMDQIIRELAIAQTEIEYQCGLGIYDDVHYWEEIAKGLLNRCYGFHLANLNEEKKNFPGIDLGDRGCGIGVQVTAEKGSTKINDTIQTMIGKKVYEEFPHLIFFILGRKQKKYTVTQNGQTVLDFDAEKDILDFGDIMEKCQTLELEDLKQAAEFLTGEISRGGTFGVGNAEKEEAYRKHLLSCTDRISIIGMAKKIPIEMAWIQLRLMDEEALQELKEKGTGRMPYKEEIRRTERKFDIESIWTSAENMVILAGPGAGKSTLLKKLVQTAVHREQKVIWLSLMDVAGLLGQGKTFDQAMRETMTASLSFEVSKAEFEYRLRYLFLDGLDECGSIRRKIGAEIVSWATAHPWVRVVVASRPLGYDAAALSDFRHMAILPMDFEECKNYVRELLEKLVPGNEGQCADWFEEHTKNRNIVELVSKSPLLLGFLLQLSIKRIDFGNSRIELYSCVMQEWLQGSSRQNEMKISETELMCGIEAVAYYMTNVMDRVHEGAWEKEKILSAVTPWLQRELNCSRLAAGQKVEYILEFWHERGILEKNYLESGMQYRFLHLNIGEYLTGKYISEMEPGEAERWVLARSGSARWHETIRMAVACDDNGFLAVSLRKHEEAAVLPTGEIFLAAEGLADRQTGTEAQNIYRSLLQFVVSDNEELVRRAVPAIQGMRALIREWDTEYLLELMKSANRRTADAAYGVYLCMPREKMDQSILRQHFLDYKERAERAFGQRPYQNMEETVKYLQRDPNDREVIETAKYYYGNHCSMNGMEILGEYLCEVGEQEWKNERDKRYFSSFDTEVMQKAFQRMDTVNNALLNIMIEIYGMDVPNKQADVKQEECLECSKLAQGLQYMQATIPELYAFGIDLKQPYCKDVIAAVGVAVGVESEQIKSELSYLHRERQENPEFRFYQNIRGVIVSRDWSKAAEGIDEEILLKGIAAYTEIVALPCMYMLVHREGKEKTKQALLKMLYVENKDVIERIGMLARYIWKEKSAEIILNRLLHGRLDVCAGLYRFFSESYGKFRTKDWMEAMLRGVSNGNSVLVQNACTCIKWGLQQEYLDGEAKEKLLSFCKEQFETWLRRKIKCVNCDAGAYLDESGFCPKCHVRGNLPYRAFMELLIDNRRLDYQELIRYGGHHSSDISGAAWEGIKSCWEENPQNIGEILEQIKEDKCPEYLFGWLLTMPENVIAGYQKQIVDVAEKEGRELQLVFLEKMNGLEWLPVKEKREYLKKMMCSTDAEVKARATKVWLVLEYDIRGVGSALLT